MVDEEEEECAIPGLEGRYLEFLGLLSCPYRSYERKNIPAKHVSGVHSEVSPSDTVMCHVCVYRKYLFDCFAGKMFSICLCLFIYLVVWLCVHLSVHLSVCRSVSLCVCPSIHPSIHSPTDAIPACIPRTIC